MDEVTDISIGCETQEGIVVSIEGTEEIEMANGETIEQTTHQSTTLTQEELENLVNESEMVLNREHLEVNGKTKITEISRPNGMKTELFIEKHDFPEEAELEEHWGVLTDSYELGTVTRGQTKFMQDLHYSIQDVEGTAFRLVSDDLVDIAYTCRLTNWKRNEDGEVEEIEVPDVPYDQGHIDLEPGDYRVWEETNPDLITE